MQLFLERLVPTPLRDKILGYESGIWNRSLTFNKGEHIFIQAPSGTGKTTLVHMLYGLRKDYEGKVLWDDNDLSAIEAEKMSVLRATYLSVIFQDMRLFPELTAWENLDIKRRLTDTVTAEQVEEWMERLGVAHRRNALGRTLSYGEQQRVAIIRSLLQPFDWLLMDEPFSHLDNVNTSKAINLITEVVTLNKAGMMLADLDENFYFPYTKTVLL